ncbi:uncharacterized protein V1516DRAFT_604923, partial [Lipomyces oligophaga]|uniref:uncharacterized protein n=1 Tax=Lipomyces oligophaga TaxID=45792 RepID=UPI0034CE7919
NQKELLEKEAQALQSGLAAILERITTAKSEFDQLDKTNKYLQDYIGNLMNSSK